MTYLDFFESILELEFLHLQLQKHILFTSKNINNPVILRKG